MKHEPGFMDGVVVVDKPAGWTSHDVVAKVRRWAHTRRVGHSGTLDPMATGVLVLGVESATRLLGRLALSDKGYDATIRLGEATTTDDAAGEITSRSSAAGVTDEAIRAGVADLTGEIDQVPATVSAVKVAGQRAYQRARAGKPVDLAPRRVTISAFDILGVRRNGAVLDVDVHVECSSGTYIRALARDLGIAVGAGGHVTALRRTHVGGYGLEAARSMAELEREFTVIPIAEVAEQNFPRLTVDAPTARLVAFGQKLPDLQVSAGAAGHEAVGAGVAGQVAVFGPDGRFLALYEDAGEGARPVAVFAK